MYTITIKTVLNLYLVLVRHQNTMGSLANVRLELISCYCGAYCLEVVHK